MWYTTDFEFIDAQQHADMTIANEQSATIAPDVGRTLTLMTASGTEVPRYADDLPACAFVHIGKTGGSTVRHYARTILDKRMAERVLVLNHDASLPRIVREFPRLRFAFTLRDPVERTISSFNSRLRAGRPAKNFPWSPQEAAAFAFFSNAAEFAAAFTGDDERLRSAAYYTLGTISHLRFGYEFQFGSPGFVASLARTGRFAYIAELETLDSDFPCLCAALGLPAPEQSAIAVPREHAAPELQQLPSATMESLRKVVVGEYAIYQALKAARQSLLQNQGAHQMTKRRNDEHS